MNGGRGRLLRGTIGIGISLVALALVIRQIDVASVAQVLSTAVPAWLGVMLLFQLIDVAVRGLRWERLLAPVHRVPYLRTLDYLLVGYLANNILPARLGELVRSHYLGDREGVSRTTTLGTVVVERVVDTTVLVAIASLAILVLQVRGVVASAVLVGVALTGLLVVGLAVALVAHRLPGAERAIVAMGRWPRVHDVARRLRGGLAVAGRPRTLGAGVLLGLVAWGSSIVAMAAAGQALGLELSTAEAALFASGIALATAIPSGPGYLGTFELAGVTIGRVLGIPTDTAFALALVVHVSILAVTSLGGSVAFIRIWRRSPARAPEPVPASGQAVATAAELPVESRP
jgi:uncharacterized protein (TIRG00374 family)